MTDPIIKKAVDLKKELADLNNAEINAQMEEVMKIILGAVQNPPGDNLSDRPKRKDKP